MARAAVTTLRDVEVLGIPSGERERLPAGSWLVVQQSLGGQFTAMVERGGLVRIDGADADALGPEYEEEVRRAREERAGAAEGPFDEQKVWEALGQVYDPEIPASIVELGLVYLVAAEPVEGGHRVAVKMTLTAPGCGMGPVLAQDVQNKLISLEPIDEANVELVWDPPWNQGMMTEAAKLQLGLM